MKPGLFLSLVLVFLAISPPLPSFALRNATVIVPDGNRIEAAVADTIELRRNGLMGRSRLQSGEGMLFIFGEADMHMMWMKNMTFPIDIVWLNDTKTIIALERSVPPCRSDPCPTYGPSLRSRYVLELPAGASGLYHLKSGMKLKFP